MERTGHWSRPARLRSRPEYRRSRGSSAWDPNDAMPGYDVRPVDPTRIKPGDFVTVITGGDRRLVGVTLDVVRLVATDGGLASPQSEPTR